MFFKPPAISKYICMIIGGQQDKNIQESENSIAMRRLANQLESKITLEKKSNVRLDETLEFLRTTNQFLKYCIHVQFIGIIDHRSIV